MSHIESVNVTITNLEALKAACGRMGAEFVENKKSYNWFGVSVGDYPIPHGFTKDDLGKCEHAIRVPGVVAEVGVVKQKDGKGYTLLYDFYGNSSAHDGGRLKEKFGTGLTKLVDQYSLAALQRKAKAKGYMHTAKVVNGKTYLTVNVT